MDWVQSLWKLTSPGASSPLGLTINFLLTANCVLQKLQAGSLTVLYASE